jgi:hypothetical protein
MMMAILAVLAGGGGPAVSVPTIAAMSVGFFQSVFRLCIGLNAEPDPDQCGSGSKTKAINQKICCIVESEYYF